MKKITLLIALAVGICSSAMAQSFDSSSRYLGVTLGFLSGDGIPVTIGYEQAVTDNIGVGGVLGFAAYNHDFNGGKTKYSDVLLAAKGNYHFLDNAKWDLYAGLVLGYNVSSSRVDWDDVKDNGYTASSGDRLIIGANVGARYLITDQWAALAEVGYGIGLISIGATYAF